MIVTKSLEILKQKKVMFSMLQKSCFTEFISVCVCVHASEPQSKYYNYHLDSFCGMEWHTTV